MSKYNCLKFTTYFALSVTVLDFLGAIGHQQSALIVATEKAWSTNIVELNEIVLRKLLWQLNGRRKRAAEMVDLTTDIRGFFCFYFFFGGGGERGGFKKFFKI